MALEEAIEDTVSSGAERAAERTDVTSLLNEMRVIRRTGVYSAQPMCLKPSEATGMGSREPDAKVADAAERLRVGRFGYRFAKRVFDIVFSVAVLILLSWLFPPLLPPLPPPLLLGVLFLGLGGAIC